MSEPIMEFLFYVAMFAIIFGLCGRKPPMARHKRRRWIA